jgi:hypothetical protein
MKKDAVPGLICLFVMFMFWQTLCSADKVGSINVALDGKVIGRAYIMYGYNDVRSGYNDVYNNTSAIGYRLESTNENTWKVLGDVEFDKTGKFPMHPSEIQVISNGWKRITGEVTFTIDGKPKGPGRFTFLRADEIEILLQGNDDWIIHPKFVQKKSGYLPTSTPQEREEIADLDRERQLKEAMQKEQAAATPGSGPILFFWLGLLFFVLVGTIVIIRKQKN